MFASSLDECICLELLFVRDFCCEIFCIWFGVALRVCVVWLVGALLFFYSRSSATFCVRGYFFINVRY